MGTLVLDGVDTETPHGFADKFSFVMIVFMTNLLRFMIIAHFGMGMQIQKSRRAKPALQIDAVV